MAELPATTEKKEAGAMIDFVIKYATVTCAASFWRQPSVCYWGIYDRTFRSVHASQGTVVR